MAGEVLDAERVPDGTTSGAIAFSTLEDGSGLCIVDPVERRRYGLTTPARVDPVPVDASLLGAPVDAAVRITTSAVTLPKRETVHVRDATNAPVTHTYDEVRSLPDGHYLVDVTAAVKLYLRVDAPVTVRPSPQATAIEFDGPTAVVVGARSPHRRPSGTVTTTEDLDDLRRAVASLGSALKTTSPERSYSTLRGHPPRLELGDAWSRPDHLAPPSTGVTVEVERSLDDLLVAAPLSFYLGADVTWGARRLSTDDGFAYPLAVGHDLETGVERALKQTFLLDCLVRTEGLYPMDLDERRRFEARFDGHLDLADLYDRPPAERLERYLEVPYRAVADLVPAWSAEAYVEPEPDAVTYLPFLLDTLSTVRTTGPRRLEGQGRARRAPRHDGGATRRAEAVDASSSPDQHLLLPETSDAVTRTWVGDGVPLGASKALAAGFEHRLDREPRDGDIRLQVVCNDAGMRDERDAVRDHYRARRDYPFDVAVGTDLSVEELRTALERDVDLFHFIGHVDRRGFRCHDGWFDAEDCTVVGADVCLLNSCRSHEQGEALVRRGAVAGIVTVTEVLNHHAAAIGRTLALFLHHGFPLYAALEVVRDTHLFGDAYALLGDPHVALFQPTTTTPEYLELESRGADAMTLTHRTFLSHWVGLGSAVAPPYLDGERHHLVGGAISTVSVSPDELEGLLALPLPLREGSDLRFSLE